MENKAAVYEKLERELPEILVKLLSSCRGTVLASLSYLEALDLYDASLQALFTLHSLINRLVILLGKWEADDEILEKTSRLIANLSGETARGPKLTKWTLAGHTFLIRELSFVECDLGIQELFRNHFN